MCVPEFARGGALASGALCCSVQLTGIVCNNEHANCAGDAAKLNLQGFTFHENSAYHAPPDIVTAAHANDRQSSQEGLKINATPAQDVWYSLDAAALDI
jgi:hypothetical protein